MKSDEGDAEDMKDEWDMSVDPSTGSWDCDEDVVLAWVRDLVVCSDRDRAVKGMPNG